jgi:hypothetical protein
LLVCGTCGSGEEDFKKIKLFSGFFTSCLENIQNFGTMSTNLKEANPRYIPAYKN